MAPNRNPDGYDLSALIPVIEPFEHGYIKVVETWGSDQRVIESARMSTDKGFLGWGDEEKPGDEKLLRYLYENKHSTPFEFGGMTLEVQAPIFVFREWHRHRTQGYNEMSGRYAVLPDLYYLPSLTRLMAGAQAKKNKQSSEEGITLEEATLMRGVMRESYDRCRQNYEDLLKRGLAREIARDVLPVAQISRMRATANLRNWLGFLTLRMDPAAQWEIRQYANAVGTFIATAFPRTWELFVEGSNAS
jgi:thymidylate synthase (FAD)